MGVHAYVVDSEIISVVDDLPIEGVRQDTAEIVVDLPAQPVDVQQACGWYEILLTPRPPQNPLQGIYFYPRIIMSENGPIQSWLRREPRDATQVTTRTVARDVAVDYVAFATDITAIKDFLSDPDIQRVLDQPNNTALTTSDLNRALKAIIRQERQLSNIAIRLARHVISDQNLEPLTFYSMPTRNVS